MKGKIITVLFIEDNPGDVRIVRKLLAEAKDVIFELEETNRLSTGLDRLNKGGIDAVLLDLGLPDSRGLETFIKLRSQVVNSPIIVLTGSFDETLGIEAVREGAQDYLLKDQLDGRALSRSILYAIERKRAEEELKTVQEYIQNIIASSPDMIVSVNRNRRIVEFNEAAQKTFGYHREEILGQSINILYANPEEAREVSETVQEVGKFIGEISNVRKNGETFPAFLSASLMRDSAGEIIGVMGVSRDITERKQAEEALRESQRRFATLVEAALEGIVIVDVDGNVVYTNAAFAETLGYTVEEIIEMNVAQLASRKQFELVPEEAEKRRKAKTSAYEVEFYHKDGEPIYFMVSASPMFGRDGMYKGAYAVLLDITDRKRAEEALLEEKEKAQRYLDIAGVMLVVIGSDYKVRMVNRKGCELLGYGESEIVGKDWYDNFIPETIAADTRLHFEKLMAGEKEPDEYFENPVLTKNGEERIILWHTAILKDENGNITGALSSGEDITKRKLAEEAMEESEKRYRTLQTNIPIGIFRSTADPGGKLLTANPALAKMLGYEKPEDIAEKRVADFYANPEERKKFIETVSSTGAINDFEVELERADGTLFWGSLSALAIERPEGGIAYLDGVLEDITERKEAEKALRESFGKLQKTVYGTVYAMSKLVEKRDPYTSGHQTRVAKLARAIAERMGLSEEQTELVYLAAIVHDVGKISVPSEVLSKPGQLTELEFDIIKTHPNVGCEILGNIDFPWPVTDVVLQHHERLDGSGYPQGLSGDDIMLEARILGLADVVEAMGSHRPYRPALGIDSALKEISDYKNILYDEAVVNTCLKLFKKDGFSFD
jgi:PAS domain S-box-containing protein/putative nucleotidyltransferase with HDIG domain